MLRFKDTYKRVKTILSNTKPEDKKHKLSQTDKQSTLSIRDDHSPLLQELEPRLMFDGAAIETVDLADGVSEQEQAYVLDALRSNDKTHASDSLLAAIEADPEGFVTDYNQFKEVVIIDTLVKDPHSIIENISREVSIEVILDDSDGVDAITQILQKYQNLDAVHIVSHGDAAKLYLGTTNLTLDNLQNYQDKIAQWGNGLGQYGQILFYGCDVAINQDGKTFLHQIKDITQAYNVAGSVDTTDKDDIELEYAVVAEPVEPVIFDDLDNYQFRLESIGGGWDNTLYITNPYDRYLFKDQSWQTASASLTVTNDGYLRIIQKSTGNIGWSQGDGTGDYAKFQADGNLVLYRNDGTPIWASGTNNYGSSTLTIQIDGHLIIRGSNSGDFWGTGYYFGSDTFGSISPTSAYSSEDTRIDGYITVSDTDGTTTYRDWGYAGPQNGDFYMIHNSGNTFAWSYTPNANWYGTQHMYLKFQDNAGGRQVYDFSITINAVNDAPTAANNTISTIEDTDYTFTASDFNFSDIDGDSLASVQLTTLETVGALKLNGVDVTLNQVISKTDIDAGLLTFTPQVNANGIGYDSFGFTVNDGTTYSTSSYTITINVNPVNDAPTAANNTISTIEDTDYTFTASDFNFSDIDGDSLASVQLTTLETVGALKLNGVDVTLNQVISKTDIDAGLLTFTPQVNANGIGYDSFGFTVNDGTTYSTSSYTITINVNPVNDAPVNNMPGVQTVDEDTALAITDLSVSDPEGNLASTQLSVNNGILTVTLSGSATISSGSNSSSDLTISGSQTDINGTLASLSYQGNANFNGSDTLTVVSTDIVGTPLTDTDSAVIIVKENNTGRVIENGDGTIGVDLDGDSQPDVNAPARSVVTENSDGTVNIANVNNQASVTVPSGSIVTVNADGTFNVTNVNNQASVTVPSGSIVTVNADGTVHIVMVDDQSFISVPSGSKVTNNTNGTVNVDVNSDGKIDAIVTKNSIIKVNNGLLNIDLNGDGQTDLFAPKSYDANIVNMEYYNPKIIQQSNILTEKAQYIPSNIINTQIDSLTNNVVSVAQNLTFEQVIDKNLNFTDALAAKQPFEVLKGIAENAIKTSLLGDSSTTLTSDQLAKDIIQQVINAQEQPKNIGIIASGMVNAAFDVGNSSNAIITGITQQVVESSLNTIEVSQLLSQMIIEADDEKRTDVIQAMINEANLNENHIVQIFNELNETSPELAEEFSQQVQSASRTENALLEDVQTTSPKGLLETLKAKLFGINTEQAEVVSYNEKQQMYQLKLAKAKILAMANNDRNTEGRHGSEKRYFSKHNA